MIFSSQLSEVDLTKTTKAVDKLIEKQKGKIVKTDDWGKRSFSYPIQKQTEGVYRHYIVELPGEAIAKINRKFALQEGMLRYLFVREGE